MNFTVCSSAINFIRTFSKSLPSKIFGYLPGSTYCLVKMPFSVKQKVQVLQKFQQIELQQLCIEVEALKREPKTVQPFLEIAKKFLVGSLQSSFILTIQESRLLEQYLRRNSFLEDRIKFANKLFAVSLESLTSKEADQLIKVYKKRRALEPAAIGRTTAPASYVASTNFIPLFWEGSGNYTLPASQESTIYPVEQSPAVLDDLTRKIFNISTYFGRYKSVFFTPTEACIIERYLRLENCADVLMKLFETTLYVNTQNTCGAGGFGAVYPAHIVLNINGDKLEVEDQPSYAVKIGMDQSYGPDVTPAVSEVEVKLAPQVGSINVYSFGRFQNITWCVMEYVKHQPIPLLGQNSQDDCALFERILNIIVTLCSQVDRLHNQLNVAHGDIKIENTLNFESQGKKTQGNIYLIDFGAAVPLPTFDEFVRLANQIVARPTYQIKLLPYFIRNPAYFELMQLGPDKNGRLVFIPGKDYWKLFQNVLRDRALQTAYENLCVFNPNIPVTRISSPIEMAPGYVGKKSDIYMLCGVIAEFLTVFDPARVFNAPETYARSLKIDFSNTGGSTFDVGFGFQGIYKIKLFDKYELGEIKFKVVLTYLERFLRCMQSQLYINRPTIEIVLLFFTTLAKLYKLLITPAATAPVYDNDKLVLLEILEKIAKFTLYREGTQSLLTTVNELKKRL
jgi:serine/threonine protein kinase